MLVLNKFPIIPNHFILATTEFKEQTDPLEASDLEASLALLEAWQQASSEKKLFAFFNSGKHSGASQRHRHVQFLPIEDMKSDGVESEWDLLMNSAANLESLPLLVFRENLSSNASTQEVHDIYSMLLTKCRQAWDAHAEKTGMEKDGFSYNMGLTTASMVLCPRTQEGVKLQRDDGTETGYIALNGTVTGGTLMVKQLEDWEYLRKAPLVIDRILGAIGVSDQS